MITCPRCDSTNFTEHDCGPDTYEDDITYTSLSCNNCGLWHDGWTDRWLVEVESYLGEEDAKEYQS